MRVTWNDRLDLDLTSTATCADLVAYLGSIGDTPGEVWCGATRLDRDHRAGVPPLVHGASLRRDPGQPAALLTDPHLAVTCGPDAGRMVPLTRDGISIGRGESCDLALADDAVSQLHATAGFDTAAWARDGGSRNGTMLIRADGTRLRARRLRPRAGEHLAVGNSIMQVRPVPTAENAGAARRGLASGSQFSAMAAGAMMGILLAVMTGRWYFALLALAYPLMTVVPLVVHRIRHRAHAEAEVAPPADPCPRTNTHVLGAGLSTLAGPVAIMGDRERALATARGVVLAQQLRPHDDSWSEPWMRWLPRAPRELTVLVVPEGRAAPSWAATVVEAHPTRAEVRAGTSTRPAPPCEVREATADALARLIAGTRGNEQLPGDVAWADLSADPAVRPGRTLVTPIGLGSDGCVALDLDLHGPHILVAGTTGSGKSALLETLVLGLAHAYSPDDLTIALIDFKGGAGLRHCMGLPHVVGCLTDLDRHLAERALVALSAELDQRKRHVARAGHGSFAEWEEAGGAPPRLLVVADEYQEIAQHHRAFLPHLARLAAQGRSLGLHLILATQRPAGAVTPEIRANVTTTIALRVASAAESQDLLGTADAALLPVDRPGRAIVARGSAHVAVQIARPTVTATAPVRPAGLSVESAPAALAQAASARWEGCEVPPRLWREPLPDSVPLPDRLDVPLHTGAPLHTAETSRVAAREFVLGLADWPAERRQGYVSWLCAQGPIAIVGPRGSGRTSALESIGSQADACGLTPVWLPSNAREAARTAFLCQDRDDVLLLVDDAGSRWTDLTECDHGMPADMLTMRLTRGLPTAIGLAIHDPARLASSAGTRVILTGSEPADDALWNVPRAFSGAPAHAGRGRLGAHGAWCEVQLCRVGAGALHAKPLVASLPNSAQVSRRCAGDTRLLGVGDDDACDLYLDRGPVTVVGMPSRERDGVIAHVERIGAANFHGATDGRTVDEGATDGRTTDSGASWTAVTVRDDLVTFPGSPRPRGTIILMQPTLRSIRDACGIAHVGLTDSGASAGRVVIIDDSGARAAQLPVA